MRGKGKNRSSNLGFSVTKGISPKNLQRKYWRGRLCKLTLEEAMVYMGMQVYSSREIGKYFKKSHTYVINVLSRAYDKLYPEVFIVKK